MTLYRQRVTPADGRTINFVEQSSHASTIMRRDDLRLENLLNVLSL